MPGNPIRLQSTTTPRDRARIRGHRRSVFVLLLACASFSAIALPGALSAQTDYYNTDKGRPLTVEDAYATERYAFELQLAPVRLERTAGGIYQWGIEPEIAYGILPRTHIEIGAPLSYVDTGRGGRKSGIAGIEISALHNLNVETRTLPALGIAGDVLLPVGAFGPDEAVFSATGIATRTFRWARFHLNGQYTFGSGDGGETSLASEREAGGTAEVSRWLAGLAVDRTFPLRSMLIGGEVFASRSRDGSDEVQWNTTIGLRKQLSPYFNIDGGIGKQLSGDSRSWFLTFGLSRAFAIRSFFPGA